MKPPYLVLIAGPAGAGKTTVAEAWAKKQSFPTVHVCLDKIRFQIKSNYATPEDGWNALSQSQYDLTQEICADMVKKYIENGYSVILDDAIFPEWKAVTYESWEKLLKEIPHEMVILTAELEHLLKRNKTRDGHRLKDDTIKLLHEMMSAWKKQERFVVIDNSRQSLEETVLELEKIIEQKRDV